MADKTAIAWCDKTANFWMGCFKVSPGCKNCYAETLTRNRMGLHVWGPAETTSRPAVKSISGNLRKWATEQTRPDLPGAPRALGPGQPLLVFVGSLMDWAEDHPDANNLREQIWTAVRAYPNLIFQLLTKRADRIRQLLPEDWDDHPNGYPNVWLGTSIEDMRVAERADHLRKIPAAVRFVSYEPALGSLEGFNLEGIDWMIFGGESGPGYRPMKVEWAQNMRDRCHESGTAYFFKQSAAPRTEMGIQLDGRIVREYPLPRA